MPGEGSSMSSKELALGSQLAGVIRASEDADRLVFSRPSFLSGLSVAAAVAKCLKQVSIGVAAHLVSLLSL